MRSWIPFLVMGLWLESAPLRSQEPGEIQQPRVLDSRLALDLFCREPEIVTPVALDVDDRGRVWVIESHTHFPKPEYDGASFDRVLTIDDRDGDGSADRFVVFADDLHHAMGLAWRSPGKIFLATRRALFLMEDRSGDGRADHRVRLARLETAGKYPHNGLTGFAFDVLGNVYFAIGENLGEAYRLIGADGAELAGGHEGGNIFRMRADGSRLERWATGFWNTFHLAFDAFGRLFAVDNDPDSRPPCRLLHIVEGGDYGYRFWLGRKGLHPFTSWNGQLPGTLPMVSGTGEAPSGLLFYEHAAFPAEYHGCAVVTSWGDNRLEVFRMRREGASFSSHPETLVQGNEMFRPVGLALAPDGSLYFSDWVDRDYSVHGKGRIWRLRLKDPPPPGEATAPLTSPPATERRVDTLLAHPTRAVRRQAARDIEGLPDGPALARGIAAGSSSPRARYEALAVLARRGDLRASDIRQLDESRAPGDVLAACVALLSEVHRGSDSREVHAVLEAAVTHRDAEVRAAALAGLHRRGSLDLVAIAAGARDPFVFSAALSSAARLEETDVLRRKSAAAAADERLAALLVWRRVSGLGKGFVPFGARRLAPPIPLLRTWLRDDEPRIRRAALQWVGEEDLQQLRDEVRQSVDSGPLDRPLLDAYLAADSLLRGENPKIRDQQSRDAFLLGLALDGGRRLELRRRALRSVSGSHDGFDRDAARRLLTEKDLGLRLETVRSLRERGEDWARELLRAWATRRSAESRLRREAILGLSLFAAAERPTLERLLADEAAAVRREAARALRGVEVDPATAARIRDLDTGPAGPPRRSEEWRRGLLAGGDPDEGELVFFHPRGPRCSACHTVQGRGGPSGPDLSAIGRRPAEHVLDSLLEPGKEIAPQFATWALVTGRGVHSGVLLGEDAAGNLRLADAAGTIHLFPVADVRARELQPTSLMPDDLDKLMTYRELRDVLAFLLTLR